MNFTKAARTAAIATAATLNAIAILALYPKDRREKEIAIAKRNIAERKAQIATRRPAPTTDNPIAQPTLELSRLKRESSKPTPAPQPAQLPDPWQTEIETPPTPKAHARKQWQFQLCLPAAKVEPTIVPAPKTAPKTKTKKLSAMTVAELKQIAADRKLPRYSKMNRRELLAALSK